MGRLRKTKTKRLSKRMSKRMSKNRKNQSKKRFSKSIKRKRGGSAQVDPECMDIENCQLIIYGEIKPNFYDISLFTKEQNKGKREKYYRLAFGKAEESREYPDLTIPQCFGGKKKDPIPSQLNPKTFPQNPNKSGTLNLLKKKKKDSAYESPPQCAGQDDGIFHNEFKVPYGKFKYLEIKVDTNSDFTYELKDYKEHPYNSKIWPKRGDIFQRNKNISLGRNEDDYFLVINTIPPSRVNPSGKKKIEIIGITGYLKEKLGMASASPYQAPQYQAQPSPYQPSTYQPQFTQYPAQPSTYQDQAPPYQPQYTQDPAQPQQPLVPTSNSALEQLKLMVRKP